MNKKQKFILVYRYIMLIGALFKATIFRKSAAENVTQKASLLMHEVNKSKHRRRYVMMRKLQELITTVQHAE